jgi:hypothetical protein
LLISSVFLQSADGFRGALAGWHNGQFALRAEEAGMAKGGRKRRARRKKNANHGKRPNS